MAELVDDAITFNDNNSRRNCYRLIGEALRNHVAGSSSSSGTLDLKSIVINLTALVTESDSPEWRTSVDSDNEFRDGNGGENDDMNSEVHNALLVEKTVKLAGPILQNIRESKTLQSIGFLCDEIDMGHMGSEEVACSITDIFLGAMLQNFQELNGSSSIEKLEIQQSDYFREPHEMFGNILRMDSSLRQLTIFLPCWGFDTSWISQAFRSNKCLEHVCINSEHGEHIAPNHVADIICSLSQHPRLQTLALLYWPAEETQDETAQALAHLLRHTGSLRRLELKWISLTEAGIRIFLDGLRSNRGSLQELDMGHHTFTCEAFMDYLTSDATAPISLRELNYHNGGLTRLAEAMERPGSVGSELRSLALRGDYEVQDFTVFFNALVSLGCRNRLESLALNKIRRDDIAAFSRFLQSSGHLRRLQVDRFPHRERECRSILMAIKKNGSLHKVSWSADSFGPYEQCRRLLDAIVLRNQLLPKLLGEAHAEQEQQVDDVSAAAVASADTSTTADALAVSAKRPALFLASMDAPRTAPHLVLMGLLQTSPDDGIAMVGRGGHGKRLRESTSEP